MRATWIDSSGVLSEQLTNSAHVALTDASAEPTAYLETFLAHLRLLVGIPFDYLVPDSRLLPDESIRFFYLDRSWTDRVIDGAASVGKFSTREYTHHHAHAPQVTAKLDQLEWSVRDRQRGRAATIELPDAPSDGETTIDAGTIITGFVLRSGVVSGWPHLEVRAFSQVLDAYPTADEMEAARVPLLRLERLSPAVMIALFAGVPKLVWLEEPHPGVQFGIKHEGGKNVVFRRLRTGQADQTGEPISVPFRVGGRRVLHINELRNRLQLAANSDADLPGQTGSAMFALEVLDLPWRQRFQSSGQNPYTTGTGGFASTFTVGARVLDDALAITLARLVES